MRRLIITLFVLLCASPLSAQQNLSSDVAVERSKYPAGKITGAQIGAIVNAVALKHVNEGWRVMRKDGGNHCPQPITGTALSCDILLHPPTGTWVDVLSDAEGDGSGIAAPSWQAHAGGDMSMALLPVETGVNPPNPPPIPPITPVPVPIPSLDLSGIYSRLEWADANNERRYQDLKAEARAAAARDLELSLNVQKVYDKPSLVEEILKSPYLYTIIGSILGGRYLLPDGK